MKDKIIHELITSPKNNRVLQQAGEEKEEWRKMRIAFDWHLVEAFVKEDPSLQSKVRYMRKILQTSQDYFQDRLDVLSTQQMDLGGLTNCHDSS
jgi:hypothetical protein